MKISARNVIKGTVVTVEKGATTAHVKIEITPGQVITASITNESVDSLKLVAGGSAYAVSYNRPISGGGDENFIFNAEVPALRFLEANGYDLTYTTDVDAQRNGALIKNHKVYMPVGHDEYWTAGQRANVEAARRTRSSPARSATSGTWCRTTGSSPRAWPSCPRPPWSSRPRPTRRSPTSTS